MIRFENLRLCSFHQNSDREKMLLVMLIGVFPTHVCPDFKMACLYWGLNRGILFVQELWRVHLPVFCLSSESSFSDMDKPKHVWEMTRMLLNFTNSFSPKPPASFLPSRFHSTDSTGLINMDGYSTAVSSVWFLKSANPWEHNA